ncbi:MAG: hypothetical protein RIG62_07630 [Cyclobacteriaceae bacterium]
MTQPPPNLFVDFVLEEDGLYLHFANASCGEAYEVSVSFSQPLLGFNRSRDLSKLRLFQHLTYMAPHKAFMIYIDDVSLFLKTLKETTIRITIEYQDAEKKAFKKEITHNLAIYQDLPIILKP